MAGEKTGVEGKTRAVEVEQARRLDTPGNSKVTEAVVGKQEVGKILDVAVDRMEVVRVEIGMSMVVAVEEAVGEGEDPMDSAMRIVEEQRSRIDQVMHMGLEEVRKEVPGKMLVAVEGVVEAELAREQVEKVGAGPERIGLTMDSVQRMVVEGVKPLEENYGYSWKQKQDSRRIELEGEEALVSLLKEVGK